MTTKPFEPFGKIHRWSREIIITEKIDGTNACIDIEATEDPSVMIVRVASRTKWITPSDDNYGFAKWVDDRGKALIAALGIGRHFGEWWGQGIQRRYGLNEKRFSLFNTHPWKQEALPDFLHVVPTLYQGPMSSMMIADQMEWLRRHGSRAAPGFMRPEGIVIFHVPSQCMFKKTIEKDDEPKSKVTA